MENSFAYADSYDETEKPYRGLRAGSQVRVDSDAPGFLVKPDVARKQLDLETREVDNKDGKDNRDLIDDDEDGTQPPPTRSSQAKALPRYGEARS